MLIGFAVAILMSLLCCGATFVLGVGTVVNAERSYYPECELAGDAKACSECCRSKGHSGNVYRGARTDEGTSCGCF